MPKIISKKKKKFEEFKHCPFCGNQKDFGWSWREGDMGQDLYRAGCARCGAEAGEELTPNKAFKLWQKRIRK